MVDVISIIATVISSVGGWEFVKYIINARFNARREEAATDMAEFKVLSETNTWLQKQLQQKEARFANQTEVVRRLNTEVLELTKQKAAIDLELQKLRCIRKQCDSRQPPNGF